MKGDFTRKTFDPKKHYAAVLMQQGRVQLDADWNEQLDITTFRVERETIDTIGECGGSIHHSDFKIVGELADLTPEESALFLESPAPSSLSAGDFLITPGRYYVDGIMCLSDHTYRYATQPDLPNPNLISVNGYHIVYLHVWQRHITKLEDPDIRETALNGPDTATRVRTIWQVKHMKVGELADDLKDCSPWGSVWIPPEDPASSGLTRGMLRAQADPQAATTDICVVPSDSGYQRLENQLYRVEIYQGSDDPGGPTFIWSRENASIVVRLEDILGDKLIVSEPGKDDVLGFAPGHWIELSDETKALKQDPGILVRLKEVDGKELTVDPTTWPGGSALTMADFDQMPTVRRWDMPNNTTGPLTVDPTNPNYVDLEGGVQIKFEGEEFRSGDYWLIPARTLDGNIIWPWEGGQPTAKEPEGIENHFCPLALVKFDSATPAPSTEIIHDCRNLFSPLTEQLRFFHVGGTGQEGMPPTAGERLPQKLEVGVAVGQNPIAGEKVRFEIVAVGAGGVGGNLHPPVGTAGTSVIVETDADGIATCEWELDANLANVSQRVEATLLTPSEVAVDDIPVLAFNANLSLASQVAYQTSAACLNPDSPTSVKDALDDLCENFTMYYVSGDGQHVMPTGTFTELPGTLQVRVANRQWPVTDGRAQVRFDLVAGAGELRNLAALTGGSTLTMALNADGLAECEWHVDDGTQIQQATATLVDNTDSVIAGNPPIVFNATLSIADQVAYDPTACPGLATASTVQEAIDLLCGLDGADIPGIHIQEVNIRSNGKPLENDSNLTISEFEQGINIVLDQAIDADTVQGSPSSPTCFVSIEVPLPVLHSSLPMAGFQSINLAAKVNTASSDRIVEWVPDSGAITWLAKALDPASNPVRNVLVRLTLKGSFIWTPGSKRSYLNGDVLGTPLGETPNNLDLPSGDALEGGDFEMWFWLRQPKGIVGDGFIIVPTLTGVLMDFGLRDALNLMIDRNALSAEGIDTGPIGPTDLAAASSAFKSAGVEMLKIGLISSRRADQKIAEIIQTTFERGGLRAETTRFTAAELSAALATGEVDILIAKERDLSTLTNRHPRFLDGSFIRI